MFVNYMDTFVYVLWPNRYDGQAQFRGWRGKWVPIWGSPENSLDNVSSLMGHAVVGRSIEISDKMRDFGDPREIK
jgi:hypothetical protein